MLGSTPHRLRLTNVGLLWLWLLMLIWLILAAQTWCRLLKLAIITTNTWSIQMVLNECFIPWTFFLCHMQVKQNNLKTALWLKTNAHVAVGSCSPVTGYIPSLPLLNWYITYVRCVSQGHINDKSAGVIQKLIFIITVDVNANLNNNPSPCTQSA